MRTYIYYLHRREEEAAKRNLKALVLCLCRVASLI